VSGWGNGREIQAPRTGVIDREATPTTWDSGRVRAIGRGKTPARAPWRRWILDADGRWREAG